MVRGLLVQTWSRPIVHGLVRGYYTCTVQELRASPDFFFSRAPDGSSSRPRIYRTVQE